MLCSLVRCKLTFHYFREYSTTNAVDILKLLKKMPRPLDKHIEEAQKQRKLLKEKGAKYASGRVTLQVLGSGATGAPNSVYLFTDQSRYLFNCGEGTQRLSYEHKMRLARLEHIFLTSATWGNMGGLPGLSLTLQDVGVPKITLHGPPGLDELFIATRRFVVLKDLEVGTAPCSTDVDYEDATMTIKYVPLAGNSESIDQPMEKDEENKMEVVADCDTKDETCNNVEPDNTDYYAHEITGKRPKTFPEIDNLLAAPRREHFSCMAYICSLKACPGTLDLQKCVNRGVKPGPMLGLLKNGQDLTLEDGTIIYSKDVRTPDDPGAIFIVIDIPSLVYLDSLEKSDAFTKHQEHTNTEADDKPTLIVHFTPKAIMENERYRAFMDKFSSDTTHLLVNDGNICSGSVEIHRTQYKLQLLNQEVFPLIGDSSIQFDDNTVSPGIKVTDSDTMKDIENKVKLLQLQWILHSKRHNADLNQNNENKIIVPASTFTTFHLRPKNGLDRTAELKLNVKEYIAEAMTAEGFPRALTELQKKTSELQKGHVKRKYPHVVFLGTGSCIPNKTRNTSGIMVHTDENNCILLDCGEGTFSQMVRFYGRDKIDKVLLNLKAVYMSHLHADHHLGFIGVLQGRRKAIDRANASRSSTLQTPLYLFAPKQIMSWLTLFDRRFERIVHEFELIPNATLVKSDEEFDDLQESILNHISLSGIETCLVRHCPNAFGVSLTTKEGKKITYSGDTMPCDPLIKIGVNCDLLIHEATMEDDLAAEAKRKMHSTAGQAVIVGRNMEAKFILLTHFSQRYARVPRLSANIENAETKDIGIAFDNMKVSLDDLPILPYFYAPLKLMFADHCEDMDNKAAKRAFRKIRANSPHKRFAGSATYSTQASIQENPDTNGKEDSALSAENKNICSVPDSIEVTIDDAAR